MDTAGVGAGYRIFLKSLPYLFFFLGGGGGRDFYFLAITACRILL